MLPKVLLEHIHFNDVLKSHTSQQEDHPILLKQMASKVVKHIRPEVLTIFTDSSNFEGGRAGSGIFISNYEEENKFSTPKPNFCSAFISGIIAAVTTKICNFVY
ncbi:hypothetical protein TNIN_319941 [Trichonephila inaurata madagascariensis]|uniref:Uncharacterized protein n=1 Tax=Trichonephila inaurata madagascariensis TaxID=2747483 RepID=A0A8X6YJY8_9ARAC|nr:hypothetical protein TNIN_319941 [Trichonephila inaurata madagascariensis]